MCFCVFSGVRAPNGAPKGGPEALLGPSWDPLGDFGRTFAPFWPQRDLAWAPT
jgi:hypothetical protein